MTNLYTIPACVCCGSSSSKRFQSQMDDHWYCENEDACISRKDDNDMAKFEKTMEAIDMEAECLKGFILFLEFVNKSFWDGEQCPDCGKWGCTGTCVDKRDEYMAAGGDDPQNLI